MYSTLVSIHAAIGTVALISFWIAGFARKGSPRHRKVGRIYLLAMLGILFTALPMAVMQLARGNTTSGLFLVYLVVITANASWSSWRSIQLKRDYARYIGSTFRWVAVLTAGAGLFILGFGWVHQETLLIGFSSVGIFRAVVMLRLMRKPAQPLWAVREHIGGMIGNGVATHIAFLSIGLRHVIPQDYAATVQTLAWFGPLLVALAAGVWFGRKYSARKSTAPASPA